MFRFHYSDVPDNLKNIVNELRNKDCVIPVIADIHFNPDVAILAAKMVDKVRINPGNFADRKTFRNIEFFHFLQNLNSFFIPEFFGLSDSPVYYGGSYIF